MVSVALSTEETQALLREVPTAYHTRIDEVLLTALLQAFVSWTGQNTLLLDVEGHGREEILDGVDLSRSVGWFTSVYPVALELTDTIDPGGALKSVKEQLRKIPNRGIGYGLLRYLCGDQEIKDRLRSLSQAEVSFNYLGQTDAAVSGLSLFRRASEAIGPLRSPRENRRYLLEIRASIESGRLQVEWIHSASLHRQATIEALADRSVVALRRLIHHCRSPEAGGLTPSDFAKARISQRDLDSLLARIHRVDPETNR
jgi:non-ribosomal peptide synthase protein (TIGR01720 family)